MVRARRWCSQWVKASNKRTQSPERSIEGSDKPIEKPGECSAFLFGWHLSGLVARGTGVLASVGAVSERPASPAKENHDDVDREETGCEEERSLEVEDNGDTVDHQPINPIV